MLKPLNKIRVVNLVNLFDIYNSIALLRKGTIDKFD